MRQCLPRPFLLAAFANAGLSQLESEVAATEVMNLRLSTPVPPTQPSTHDSARWLGRNWMLPVVGSPANTLPLDMRSSRSIVGRRQGRARHGGFGERTLASENIRLLWGRSPPDSLGGFGVVSGHSLRSIDDRYVRRTGTAALGLKYWKADDAGNARPCRFSGLPLARSESTPLLPLSCGFSKSKNCHRLRCLPDGPSCAKNC